MRQVKSCTTSNPNTNLLLPSKSQKRNHNYKIRRQEFTCHTRSRMLHICHRHEASDQSVLIPGCKMRITLLDKNMQVLSIN